MAHNSETLAGHGFGGTLLPSDAAPLLSGPTAATLRDQQIIDTLGKAKASVAEVQSLINEHVADSYQGAASAVDTAAGNVGAKLLAHRAIIGGAVKAVDNSVGKNVSRSLDKVMPLYDSLGFDRPAPLWEQNLYEQLPAAQAYETSTLIKQQPNLDPASQATVAQQILNANAAGMGTALPPPIAPLLQIVPVQNAAGQGPVIVNEGGNIQKVPPAPPGDPIQPCNAYLVCGTCRMPDGSIVGLGNMPDVPFDHFAPRPPTDAERLQCRLLGASSMTWNVITHAYDCINPGSNFACPTTPPGPTAPPPPDVPPPPPPDGGTTVPGPGGPVCTLEPETACVPIFTNPETGQQYWPFPMPTILANPAGGGGVVGGGGQVSNSGSGGTIVNVSPPNVSVTVPVTINDDFPSDVPPPPPPPEQTVPYTVKLGGYDDPNTACNSFAATAVQGGVTGSGGTSGGITGPVISGASSIYSWIVSPLVGSDNVFSKALAESIKAGQKSLDEWVKVAQVSDTCQKSVWIDLAARIGTNVWTERVTGMPVGYLSQSLTYALQYICPQFLPDQGALDTMYLNHALTREQWECYTRAQGNLPNLARLNAELGRSRPSLHDVIKLKRLGVISTDDATHRVGELGYLTDADASLAIKAYDELPSQGTLIQWMVRDAFDDEVVADNQLYTDFKEKYTDDIKKLANAQGITDDTMYRDWVSHWQSVSPTQLYQMIHRLRPGAVAENLVVTIDQARQQLLINDVTPAYVDKLIAISFNVPTRVDLKRGFFIDTIERKDLVSGLQDVGYDADTAELLAKVFDDEKTIYKQEQAQRYSVWTPKSAAKAYSNAELTEAELQEILIALEVPNERLQGLIDGAKSAADSEAKAACIKGIRHRFLIGDIDDDAASSRLAGYGVESDQADTLVQKWKCELDSRAKEVGAAKNVAWFKKDLITQAELSRRLDNLGFTPDGVQGYISEALKDLQDKQQAAIDKALKEAERAAAAAAKAAQKLADSYKPKKRRTQSKATKTTEALPGGVTETDTDTTTTTQKLAP